LFNDKNGNCHYLYKMSESSLLLLFHFRWKYLNVKFAIPTIIAPNANPKAKFDVENVVTLVGISEIFASIASFM